MWFTNTVTGKKDGIRARASIYPLTATFTPQPPLTRSLEATNPLTSPSRALGTLAKLTSVAGITGEDRVNTRFGVWNPCSRPQCPQSGRLTRRIPIDQDQRNRL